MIITSNLLYLTKKTLKYCQSFYLYVLFLYICIKRIIMGSVNLIIKLPIVVFMSCQPLLCYSNMSEDYFNTLSEKAVFSLDKLYSDYTQIIVDLPDGQSDTIWIEAKKDTYINNLFDGRREIININTFKSPEIDIESPKYTKDTIEGGIRIIINDAKYPTDAISKDINGVVSATCIVEKDGSLSDIKIIEQLYPSIDKEAFRILSQTKLIPCKLGDKTFRCHFKIALSFFIKRDLNNKKNTVGIVCLKNASDLPNGVAKRFTLGLSKSKVSYSTSQGRTTYQELGEEWHTSLEIDIPENNPYLEQVLCRTLFEKKGESLEKTGNVFAKDFEGKIKNKDFKNIAAKNLILIAHVLGYKKDKYYSYAYTTQLDKKKITHNILYDIQGKRMLSATDILTQTYLEKFSDNMGIEDLNNLEIGMDDYFLYIGRAEEIYVTISLSQENWNIFTSTMQNLLGNKMSLPISLNEGDFEYSKEHNFFDYGGGSSKINFNQKGFKTVREGIHPVGIRKKIIRKPNLGSKESLFHEYLTEIWQKNEMQPDSDGFVACISFVLNKNQTISNFQTKLKEGDEKLYQIFVDLIKKNTKWKPMIFAIDGPTKSYFNYEIKIGGKVYDYVDIMPEFPGGGPALFQWISNEINIPDDVTETSLKKVKRILASCIIEEDGSVSNAKIETSIDDYMKKEIERVLAIMPKWIPGKRYGKEVRVRTFFPLKMSINR